VAVGLGISVGHRACPGLVHLVASCPSYKGFVRSVQPFAGNSFSIPGICGEIFLSRRIR
jgi:hypothetical protein